VTINPNAPVYPEKDISLLPTGEPWIGPSQPQYIDPNFGIPNDQAQPEVDISLLPGVTGQRGPQGEQGEQGQDGQDGQDGVAAAVAPLAYSATTKTVSLNQSAIQINASQVSGLPQALSYFFSFTPDDSRAVWDITHNLGYYPSVRVVNSVGTEFIGDVVYNSNNRLTITFSSPVFGTVYLS
jgi:hypothetical protein